MFYWVIYFDYFTHIIYLENWIGTHAFIDEISL